MRGNTACLIIAIILLAGVNAHAQDMRQPNFFDVKDPLAIRLSVSLSELRKKTNDSTYITSVLGFKNGNGTWDSIPISIRTRGNFRKKNCTYPPLRIKFNATDVKGTVFEGIDAVKLVVPCHVGKASMELINKEYLCYKMYHPITDFHLETRLLDIKLVEKGKREKVSQINGFFIEDDDRLAGRVNSTVVKDERINPMQLEDTSAIRFDFFQYMIANTDFSTTVIHNAEVLLTRRGRYIAVPYDFDMTGFVNAPYATFDPKWEIERVTDRAYKGYCRNEKIAEYVRQEFIKDEDAIYQILDAHKELFTPREAESLKNYVSEFFAILKSDNTYHEKIIAKCRK